MGIKQWELSSSPIPSLCFPPTPSPSYRHVAEVQDLAPPRVTITTCAIHPPPIHLHQPKNITIVKQKVYRQKTARRKYPSGEEDGWWTDLLYWTQTASWKFFPRLKSNFEDRFNWSLLIFANVVTRNAIPTNGARNVVATKVGIPGNAARNVLLMNVLLAFLSIATGFGTQQRY